MREIRARLVTLDGVSSEHWLRGYARPPQRLVKPLDYKARYFIEAGEMRSEFSYRTYALATMHSSSMDGRETIWIYHEVDEVGSLREDLATSQRMVERLRAKLAVAERERDEWKQRYRVGQSRRVALREQLNELSTEAARERDRLRDILLAKKLWQTAPCCICGYNGPGYYQPATHPCAAGVVTEEEREAHDHVCTYACADTDCWRVVGPDEEEKS